MVRLGSVRLGFPQVGSVHLGLVRFSSVSSVRFGLSRFGSVHLGSVPSTSVSFGYLGSVRISSVMIDFHFLLKNDSWVETSLKILYFKIFSSLLY